MPITISESNINTLNSNGVNVFVDDVEITDTTTVNSGEVIKLEVEPPLVFSSSAWVNDAGRALLVAGGQFGSTYTGFSIDGDFNSVATFTMTSASFNSIDALPTIVQGELLATLRQGEIDALDNSGVTLKINGVEAVLGSEIRVDDELIATAEEGRKFINVTITENVAEPILDVPSFYFFFSSQFGSGVYLTFEANEDETIVNATVTEPSFEVVNFTLTSQTEQADTIVGTNNVYLIDEDKLADINRERFKTVIEGGDGSPGTGTEVVYDYGQFILSLLSLPFTIPEEYIALPEAITLANLETNVTADKITADLIKIELGEIEVVGSNENMLDYLNTVALIHLPRIEPFAIELEYVIDQVISVEYLIDCYTGRATVNIYSSKVDSAIITKQVDIGVSIPFANTNQNASVNNSNIEVGGENFVTNPFIEIVRNDAILSDGFFTIPIVDESNLSEVSGFIQVQNIDLKTNAVNQEKQQIVSILSSGVIINE